MLGFTRIPGSPTSLHLVIVPHPHLDLGWVRAEAILGRVVWGGAECLCMYYTSTYICGPSSRTFVSPPILHRGTTLPGDLWDPQVEEK
jgi:hypothetical protein